MPSSVFGLRKKEVSPFSALAAPTATRRRRRVVALMMDSAGLLLHYESGNLEKKEPKYKEKGGAVLLHITFQRARNVKDRPDKVRWMHICVHTHTHTHTHSSHLNAQHFL